MNEARYRAGSRVGSLVCSTAMKIAEIAPPWFAVPPTGYGGIELVVALLADGFADRGHDVTLFASGGSQTKAKLVSPLVDPPDPALLGNLWFDAYHAVASYLAIGRRVRHRARPQRHRRVPRWAHSAAATHRSCTRCTVRGPSRHAVGTTDWSHDHVHLVAISEAQRADNPDVTYAGRRSQRHRARRLPRSAREKDDFLVYIGRANPDKGPTIAIEVARRAGLPLAMVVKKNEPFERTYWDEIVAPLLNDEVEVYEAISHRQKVDLLARRARWCSRSSGPSRSGW